MDAIDKCVEEFREYKRSGRPFDEADLREMLHRVAAPSANGRFWATKEEAIELLTPDERKALLTRWAEAANVVLMTREAIQDGLLFGFRELDRGRWVREIGDGRTAEAAAASSDKGLWIGYVTVGSGPERVLERASHQRFFTLTECLKTLNAQYFTPATKNRPQMCDADAPGFAVRCSLEAGHRGVHRAHGGLLAWSEMGRVWLGAE
jgi:hypothetical protein